MPNIHQRAGETKGNYIHGYISPFLQKSSCRLAFVLDYIGVVSYYRDMASYYLTIKKEIVAQEYGFCTCCGNRYETGDAVLVLNEQPSARGRIAHKSCVAKNNARIEKSMKRNNESGNCYQGVEA